jgi:hypothetical protein
MKLYESLPPEAKQSLVEKKLAPLLDLVPKERAKKGTNLSFREFKNLVLIGAK